MNDQEHIIYRYIDGTGLVWIYALILVIVFIYTVIKLRKQVQKAKGTGKKSSKDLLKERYERGEISRKEYETKKRNLK